MHLCKIRAALLVNVLPALLAHFIDRVTLLLSYQFSILHLVKALISTTSPTPKRCILSSSAGMVTLRFQPDPEDYSTFVDVKAAGEV